MQFKRFQFMTDWEWLVLIPTIQLIRNEQIYMDKNFRVSLHWLGWHLSWLWVERRDDG